MDSTDEMQKMIDAGIRFSISTFWEGGFNIKLGDYRERVEAESVFSTVDQAVSWLMGQIKIRYPESLYARQLLNRQLLLHA
jgi:hypothetical protein